MVCAPQSLDVNPMERLWNELDHNARKRRPQSHKQLREELLDPWHNIPLDVLQKFGLRLPKICKALIKCKSGYCSEMKLD